MTPTPEAFEDFTEKNKKYRNVVIEGRKYRIGQLSAMVGNWILEQTGEAVSEATHRTMQAHLFDEAGREIWIDGSQIQEVQLVDVNQEVLMNTRLAIVVRQLERDLLAIAGEGPPSQAIGGRTPIAEVVPMPQRIPTAIGQFAG